MDGKLFGVHCFKVVMENWLSIEVGFVRDSVSLMRLRLMLWWGNGGVNGDCV